MLLEEFLLKSSGVKGILVRPLRPIVLKFQILDYYSTLVIEVYVVVVSVDS